MREVVQSKVWRLKRFNLFEEFEPAEMETLVSIIHVEANAPTASIDEASRCRYDAHHRSLGGCAVLLRGNYRLSPQAAA